MHLKQQNLTNLKIPKSNKFYKTTPMMSQYLEVKERHKEYLLFYRMGDFYELFFGDAHIASKELGIALTKRGKLNDEDIPMCGVPFHSVQNYLSRLIKLGYKIAIAEQLDEDPSEEKKKKKSSKLFKRDVVRIITPGTILDESLLDSKQYNFLTSIYLNKGKGCVSWVDMTTGVFNLKILNNASLEIELSELLHKIEPGEIITSEEVVNNVILKDYLKAWKEKITLIPETFFDEKNNIEKLESFFKVSNIISLGELSSTAISVSGALIEYLRLTQKGNVPNITKLKIIKDEKFMVLDKISSQSLELFSRINGERKGSLLDTIDYTVTPSGARMLKEQLKNPLLDIKSINNRLDYISAFLNESSIINEARDTLSGLPDIERALSRIGAQLRNPRDVLIVFNFINKSLQAFKIIKKPNNSLLDELIVSQKSIENLFILCSEIKKKINEVPPLNFNDGGVIKENVSEELDNLRNIKNLNKNKIIEFQMKYSKVADLNNLKIKYNNFHGYFIETSNKNSFKIRECKDYEFQLIQNTLHSSRFQTVELKRISQEIDDAETKAIELEKEIYRKVCEKILEEFSLLNLLSQSIAFIDVMISHAFLARKSNFVRPTFSAKQKLEIIDGRHPVVEESLLNSAKTFTPNDCCLDSDSKTWLMTGPNMAGKSTFLRQVAIITIMSQIGSFVPAKKVHMSVLDKIFTRVGASDDLSQGLSTFMTEMVETSRILNGATENSLIILDELGRGTSTSDGLSLAWAILEFIMLNKKCTTFFATHYKELTLLKSDFKNLKLKTMKTKEWEDEIIFMYKVIDGVSESSYGLHVAKLAGIQSSIILRAKNILMKYDKNTQQKTIKNNVLKTDIEKTDKYLKVIEILKKIDPNQITPKDALELIYNLKNKILNR